MAGVAGLTAVAGIVWLTSGGGFDLVGASNPTTGSEADDGRAKEGGTQEGKEGKEGGKDGGGKEGGKEGKEGGKEGDSSDDDRRGRDWNGEKNRGDDRDKSLPCDPDELIAAITHANANGGGKIRLAPRCNYILTANQHGDGLPRIVQPIDITGEETTISRAANADPFRLFTVNTGGDLTLRHVTLKNGKADGGPRRRAERTGDASDPGDGVSGNPGGHHGGAVLVKAGGTLRLEHSTVRDSTAAVGGAISNAGTTTLSASKVTDNTATHRGGGVYNEGFLGAEHTHLSYNKARYSGGGLENAHGVATLKHAAVNDNAAGAGGGIRASGHGTVTTVQESTISDNTAGRDGGGVLNEGGPFTLRHSTVSRNTAAGHGGGVANSNVFVAEEAVINSNRTTQGNGGGIANGRGDVVLRRSEVTANKASGPHAVAGGIFNERGTVVLTDSRVIDNSSTRKPGGIFSRHGRVEVDHESVIIKNRPTNCVGSPDKISNCFG